MIRKLFTFGIFLILTLLLVPSALASHFVSFLSPTVGDCNLVYVQILAIFTFSAGGDADLTYAETINGSGTGAGDLIDTITGPVYNFDSFNIGAYPYNFSAIFSVKSLATGELLEQYELSGTCTGLNTGTVSFSEIVAPVSSSSDEPQPAFRDGRLNNWDTGSPVVPFGHDYETGRGLVVYSPEGNLLLAVTPEQIAAVAECPSENTLIASAGSVALYRLTSCQYQLNAPSLDGIKIYVLIFNALYENTGYSSHEE